MRLLLTSLLLVQPILAPDAYATGLNFWESSSLNSSLASANGAIGNDASVLALAPSSMSQLSKPTISASLTYYEVTTDYSIFGNETQYNTANPIPMGFYVTPVNENLSFGLGIYSRTAADISVPSIVLVHPNETRVTPITVSVSPSISYKIGDISLGASLEYIHAQYALEQTSCFFALCDTTTQEDTTHGWSGAISGTWVINSFASIALAHRLSTQFGDGNIDIDLPAITSLYSSIAFSQSITWHSTYSYTQWNDKGITYTDYDDVIGLLIGSQDSQRLATSLEYRLGNWSFRGGVSFDEAIDQFGGIDKRYRLGVGYVINENLELNLAIVNENYAKKEAVVDTTTLVKVQNSGNAYSLGASYKF